jgi:hypothetical protein
LVELPVRPTTAFNLRARAWSRIVEVDLARLDLPLQVLRQRVRVDLQPTASAVFGSLRADAAVLRSRDRFVQLQGVAEEGLRAEGVEAEDLPALRDRVACVLVD